MDSAPVSFGTLKIGKLITGQFEPGNAIYWEIRRHQGTYLVYRSANAVTEMGRFSTAAEAYELLHRHVPPSRPGDDLESSRSL